MKNKTTRYLTVVLAIWMLIVSIPLTVFADLLNITVQPEMDEIVYVLAEDNTKRTEFEKHYYCSDGTFVAVTYPEAVHYQNEQGEWVDVDMRLASDNTAQAYESQSGNFKTTFSKPGTQSDASVMSAGAMSANVPAVNMQSGDYSLSWSLTGTKPMSVSAGTYALDAAMESGNTVLSASADAQVQVKGGMKTAQAAFSVSKIPVTNPDAFALPSASNQVIYEDIFGAAQNVSVRYSVSMNKIEEDILITAPTDITSFSMQVDCGALTPVLNDDNSVNFLDNQGQMVYHVSIPYLADAALAVSYDVEVTLTEQDGTCTITYTPDAEWMNAPEREYPIMLDPAVTTRDYNTSIMDTYVESNTQTCYLSNQYLRINQEDGAQRVALMQIVSLPNIDPSMPIISASLDMTTLVPLYTADSVDIKLEALDAELNMLMVKYADLTSVTRTEVDRYTFTNTLARMSFDITSCITDLYSGNLTGYFAISLAEDFDLFVPPIYSSDDQVPSIRPKMTITYGYNLPEGLAANDEITIRNAGSQGYLYPNFASIVNGTLVLHASGTTLDDHYRLLTLRKNSSNGTYRLEYTPSSSSNGAYFSADMTTKKVVMYNTTNVPSNIRQDWLIVPDSVNTFKIVLASDMSYVMTAVGNADTGYVSVAPITSIPIGNQNNQSWLIYEDGALLYGLAMTSPPLTTDIYYVNNKETGRFISYNDTYDSLGAISGKVADIGDMIAWKITKLPDGYYTIQNSKNLDEFLTVQLGTVTMATCSDTIPNICKWRIEPTSEYFYLKNVGTNKYLYANTDESCLNPLGLEDNNASPTCRWRVIVPSSYVELTNQSTFNDLALVINNFKFPTINKIPQDALWSSYSDFSYITVTNSECVSYNSTSNYFRGLEQGEVKVIATHKVTAQQYVFYVDVGYVSADAAALAFATEIFAASIYILHEYATVIYKVNHGLDTLYYYTPPVAGEPHYVYPPLNSVPENVTKVAYSHTHPNSNKFSQLDKKFAVDNQLYGYVNGPDLMVRKYNYITEESVEVGTITPKPLTVSEKQSLYEEFYNSWYNHLNNEGIGFDCESKTWPTQ